MGVCGNIAIDNCRMHLKCWRFLEKDKLYQMWCTYFLHRVYINITHCQPTSNSNIKRQFFLLDTRRFLRINGSVTVSHSRQTLSRGCRCWYGWPKYFDCFTCMTSLGIHWFHRTLLTIITGYIYRLHKTIIAHIDREQNKQRFPSEH